MSALFTPVLLFYPRPNQQHHRSAKLVPHAGDIQHTFRRLCFHSSLEFKAAVQQAHQYLGQSMVVFLYSASKKYVSRIPGR